MKLQPLEYHRKLRDYLKSQSKTWSWFASVNVKEEQLKEFKTNLLKNTYRLDKETNPDLYDRIDLAKVKLGLDVAVTLYQAQNGIDNNAGVSFLSGEAHIVLSGPILKLLSGDELLAVFAHELAHVKLLTAEGCEFEIADRVITAIANDFRSDDVYVESARLFRLYTELYCDRGSLVVTEKVETVLSGLIKMNTGLEEVSVDSYLKQTDEIFMAEKVKSDFDTHPETYIRVKALEIWHAEKDKAEEKIRDMIEGEVHLNNLDLFKQMDVSDLTFNLVRLILKPRWARTTAVMSLAKQYKNNFTTDDEMVITNDLVDCINSMTNSVKEYLAYVLLDFALVDPTLEDIPMGFAFQLAEDLSLKSNFNEVVKKELKLGERKLSELQKRAAKALAEVNESSQEHIYEN